MSKPNVPASSHYARIRHLTPNPRLHLQFLRRSPSPSPTQPPPACPLPSTMRPRSFSTTTHLRSNWAGRQPREDAGTENATDKHNVQHYASQASHKEKANGTSGSAALDEEPSTEGKKGKEKVKVQFPAASKNGPIIGFEDERGGVSISAFGVWALGFGLVWLESE